MFITKRREKAANLLKSRSFLHLIRWVRRRPSKVIADLPKKCQKLASSCWREQVCIFVLIKHTIAGNIKYHTRLLALAAGPSSSPTLYDCREHQIPYKIIGIGSRTF